MSATEFPLALLGHEFQNIVEQIASAMIVTSPLSNDAPPTILYANREFEKLSGYERSELIGKSPKIFQGQNSNHTGFVRMKELLESGKPFEVQSINYRKDGSSYYVNIAITPIKDQNGAISCHVGILHDITAKIKRLKALNLSQRAIRDSKDHIAVFDSNGCFMFINEAYSNRYGYTCKEIEGKPSNILKSGKHTQEFYQKLWNRLKEGQAVRELFVNKTKNGNLVYEEQHISPVYENGTISAFITIGRDIKTTLDRQHELEKKASNDHLTDVYNRYGFEKHLEAAFKDHLLNNTEYSIIIADLDHFKLVNDTYGHQYGDEILKGFADILKMSLRTHDIIARLGGEEFAILLRTDVRNATIVCHNICKNLSLMQFGEHRIKITSSFGIAPFDENGIDVIIENADKALYQSKKNGRNRITSSEETTLIKAMNKPLSQTETCGDKIGNV